MSNLSKQNHGKTGRSMPPTANGRVGRTSAKVLEIKDGHVVVRASIKKQNRHERMKFYRDLSKMEPLNEIEIIRRGVPFSLVRILAEDLDINERQVLQALHIPKSTFARRVKKRMPMSTEESERALALAKLVTEAQRIYRESGDESAPDFDVQAWIGRWLERGNLALGGRTPAEMLDTAIGRSVVLGLIRKMQSGAYA